jgi:hypothetical protein
VPRKRASLERGDDIFILKGLPVSLTTIVLEDLYELYPSIVLFLGVADVVAIFFFPSLPRSDNIPALLVRKDNDRRLTAMISYKRI